MRWAWWRRDPFADVDEPRCSFCGKARRVVANLIAGPGVFICSECVALCNRIISDNLSETPGQSG